MSVPSTTLILRLLLALLGGGLFIGCQGIDPIKGDGYYAVTAKETQLYRFGPAQTSGADSVLKQGRRLIMLRQEYGYSRVKTEDDQQTGFVANEHIAPAPPPKKTPGGTAGNPFGNLPPLPSRGTGIPGVSSANRAVIQSGPLFGPSELPPLPDAIDGQGSKPGFRATKPKPGFRIHVPPPNAPGSDDKPTKE